MNQPYSAKTHDHYINTNEVGVESRFQEIQQQIDNQYVVNTISHLSIIRWMIDGAINFGNQATNINLMRRLREIGFNGTYEVFYDVSGKSKILQLLNQPYIQENNFELPHLSMKFINMDEIELYHQNNQLPNARLGVTGAIDYPQNVYHTSSILKTYFSSPTNITHFADIFNVDVFLRLYPHSYAEAQYNTQIYVKNTPNDIVIQDSASMPLIVPITTYSEFKTLLFSTHQGLELQKNYPAISTLVSKLDNQTILFQPMYGWTLTETPENLLNMMLGTRYAQLHFPALANQPVVMAAFMDLNTSLNNLPGNRTTLSVVQQLIGSNDWSPLENKDSSVNTRVKQSIDNLSLRTVFKTAKLDQEGKQTLEQLRANDFLLLQMPPLAKDFFDGLSTFPDALPLIREGTMYVNTLQKKHKTPHIRCRSERPWEIDTTIASPSLQQRLAHFVKTICIPYKTKQLNFTNWENENIDQLIGEYVGDAMAEDSELREFFNLHKNEARKPENDRILTGLQASFIFAAYDQLTDAINEPPLLEANSSDLNIGQESLNTNDSYLNPIFGLMSFILLFWLFYRKGSVVEFNEITESDKNNLSALNKRLIDLENQFKKKINDSIENSYYVNKDKYQDIKHCITKLGNIFEKLKEKTEIKSNKIAQIESYLDKIVGWLPKLVISEEEEIAKLKQKKSEGKVSFFYKKVGQEEQSNDKDITVPLNHNYFMKLSL